MGPGGHSSAAPLQQATLLGSAVAGTGSVVAEPNDPRNVIVKKLALVVEGRPDGEIDLTQDLKEIKKKVLARGGAANLNKQMRLHICPFQTFVIKEGIQFRIRIDFLIQREIVTGLKYVQKTSRMGVTGGTQLLLAGRDCSRDSSSAQWTR